MAKLIVAGRNPVLELLHSKITCLEIYLQSEIRQDEKITKIMSLAKSKGIPLKSTSTKDLDKRAGKDVQHQGVLAISAGFAPTLDLQNLEITNNNLYVYIREAHHDHNAGAIIRSAEGMGASGVILPPNYTPSPNSVRIAMGANFHIPIAFHNFFETIKLFKKQGFAICGIEITGTKFIYEHPFSSPTLLIVGGEDKSLSGSAADKIDNLLLIPQLGNVNSLNMSVAAAITIYEWRRQNSMNKI